MGYPERGPEVLFVLCPSQPLDLASRHHHPLLLRPGRAVATGLMVLEVLLPPGGDAAPLVPAVPANFHDGVDVVDEHRERRLLRNHQCVSQPQNLAQRETSLLSLPLWERD